MKTIRLALLTILVCFGSLVSAQDLQKGLEAFRRGDYQIALQEWRPLAEQGYAAAQYNLGLMYDDGHGVVQDYREAVKWYRLSAEQGYVNACAKLGVVHALGRGVPENFLYAHMWFNVAASLGSVEGSLGKTALETVMTAEQLSEAQQLATYCVRKNYKNCD